MSSDWFYPRDDITAAVWLYLKLRYSPREARQRRDWLAGIIRRLAAHHDVIALHDAMRDAVNRYLGEREQQALRTRLRAHVARQLRYIKQAVSGRLGLGVYSDVDDLLTWRDSLSSLRLRRRPGRPWEHVTSLKQRLQELGIPSEDRHDICEALGFIDPK